MRMYQKKTIAKVKPKGKKNGKTKVRRRKRK